MSKEYSRESIAHALAHHEGRGALLSVSPPEPGGRSTWRVVLAKFPFDPKLLSEPQAYALCLGLAASEDHARIEHERFVHELHAYNGDESPACVDEPAARVTSKLPPGTRCGIHGESTESGRCESCDMATARSLIEQLDAASTLDAAEQPFEDLCKLVDITHSRAVRVAAFEWSRTGGGES